MYTLYNNSASPYGLKTLALIGYSGVQCRVITQNIVTRFTVIKRLTGDTKIPMLRTRDGAISDSTEIAQRIMRESTRRMLPRDPNLAELCWLLEDFADEWMARILLYSRWHTVEDSEEVAQIVGSELGGGLPWVSQALGALSERVIPKSVAPMGIIVSNADALEYSRERILLSLETVFSSGPMYLFEGYPTVADFAFYGVLGQFFRDPSGRARAGEFPNLRRYLGRLELMCLPLSEIRVNEQQPSRDLKDLHAVFAELMGTYWPLLVANFRAKSAFSDKIEAKKRCEKKKKVGKRQKQARAMMLDGSSYQFVPSSYLNDQLMILLTLIDKAYLKRDELFGESGLRLESALVANIAALSRHPEGRELLREFPNLGLH